MTLGPNQIHPLLIEDARQAAHDASELQRQVEDAIKNASRELAEAERSYRKKLSERILTLKADGVAVTACSDIARGETAVADLRYERDVKEGILEATRQQAYRRGSDRRDLHQLLVWSQARDLRTDAPPAPGDESHVFGSGRPTPVAA